MARIRGVVAWGLVALLCVGLGIPSVEAVTSTGALTSTADNQINQNSTTRTNGSCTTNPVNARSGRAQRVLVRFDVSTIPSDAAIKSANLALVQTVAGTNALRTHNAHRITANWGEVSVSSCNVTCATVGATWARANSTATCTPAWTTAGGNFNATATASVVNVPTTGTVTWDIKADVQAYVLGTATNFGTLIKDSLENAGAANTHTYGMKENATAGNRPSLTVTYLRQVTNLTASASNGQVILNWTLPTPGGDYNGTLVVRKAGSDFTANDSSNPVDTTAYVATNTIGDGEVVSNDTTSATSFTDNTAANGTTYFYRVYARDSSINYSASTTSGANPTYPKVSATPPDGTTQKYNWSYTTGATTLASPGLTPNGVVVSGSNDSKLHGMSASTGTRSFAPFATGNAIQARPPVIPAALSTLLADIAYVTSQDGFAYGIDTADGTQRWKSASLGTTLQGGAAVWLQAVKLLTVKTPPQPDLVVVGTKNSDATSNKVYGLNGDDGTTLWTFAPGNMDIIVSTPFIDYTNNTIWVTSRSNATTQASLWKLNAADGTLITRVPSAGPWVDIDGSPSNSLDGSFLYVPDNAGAMRAININTNAVVATHTPASGTGAIQGFPLPFSFSTPSSGTPDTIVFSRTNTVHSVSFNGTSFGTNWTTTNFPSAPPASISAPVDNFDGTKVYVGASDGKAHQLRLSDGVDETQVSFVGTPTGGDPSFDITLGRVYIGATDGKIYSFTSPF